MTAVRLLAPRLTIENHRDVLASARHKNKRDVELLIANLRPQPDVPAVVRKLPTRAGVPSPATTRAALPPVLEPTEPPTARPSPVAAPRQAARAEVKPIAPERFKIQFTASRETYESPGARKTCCGTRCRMAIPLSSSTGHSHCSSQSSNERRPQQPIVLGLIACVNARRATSLLT